MKTGQKNSKKKFTRPQKALHTLKIKLRKYVKQINSDKFIFGDKPQLAGRFAIRIDSIDLQHWSALLVFYDRLTVDKYKIKPMDFTVYTGNGKIPDAAATRCTWVYIRRNCFASTDFYRTANDFLSDLLNK